MGKISSILGMSKKIYGYDSFEGFPEPNIKDSSFRKPKKGDWSILQKNMLKNIFLKAKF